MNIVTRIAVLKKNMNNDTLVSLLIMPNFQSFVNTTTRDEALIKNLNNDTQSDTTQKKSMVSKHHKNQ